MTSFYLMREQGGVHGVERQHMWRHESKKPLVSTTFQQSQASLCEKGKW